jgi:HSP20 family protein
VQRRAFEIFEHRKSSGSATDDWFEAERELTAATSCELAEKNGAFEFSLGLPGFKPRDIEVTAFPNALVVIAESSDEHEQETNKLHYHGFSGKFFFRKAPLPEPIDTEKVTAELHDGILRIRARKTESASNMARAAA